MSEKPSALMGALLFMGISVAIFTAVVGGLWWVTGQ
jgi:hypothetical protein